MDAGSGSTKKSRLPLSPGPHGLRRGPPNFPSVLWELTWPGFPGGWAVSSDLAS